MKKFIFMAAFALMTVLSFSSCERVDAGHEGILENDVRLGNLPKWFKSVQEFLTKEV